MTENKKLIRLELAAKLLGRSWIAPEPINEETALMSVRNALKVADMLIKEAEREL